MKALCDGRARARRARAAGRGDPRGPGRPAGRGDQDHRRGLGRRHGADAGQARRRGAQRGRDRHRRGRRHAAGAARARRRRHLAARAPRRRADLGQRAADPPRRRAPRLPRGRRQRHLRPRRRRPGTRSPPPPTCTSAAPSSWAARPRRKILAPRASTAWSPRPTCSPRASRACSTGSRPRSSTSTTCCPTTSRCSGFTGEATWRRAAGRCVERGVGCVAATCGADGVAGRRRRGTSACRRSRSRWSTRPAAATRSRPASCAGSRSAATAARPRVLGCAAAALVAQGLGSDHGDFDLAAADAFAA